MYLIPLRPEAPREEIYRDPSYRRHHCLKLWSSWIPRSITIMDSLLPSNRDFPSHPAKPELTPCSPGPKPPQPLEGLALLLGPSARLLCSGAAPPPGLRLCSVPGSLISNSAQ